MTTKIYRPSARFDVLKLPVLGRLLRWRWGRLLLQLLLLAVAALIIYDGFTGPQLAPENIATVSAWLHYRGLVVLALLFFGNLFCMSCPFTLPRTLARKLAGRGRRWPRTLRNKWLAIGAFVLFLFAYEWFDLWASPLLTAWVAVGYFLLSFLLEAIFAGSPFCKYVCPLGTFNFTASTISPTQITVTDPDVCRTCEGKECVNGSADVLGCGTELFPPQITSNIDCVLCLDCARACPYDNVALAVRSPLHELSRPEAQLRRWDWGFLILTFAFAGLANAFGMVPPVFALQEAVAAWLGTQSEGLVLALIFGAILVAIPAVVGLSVAWLSRALSGRDEPLRASFSRFVPAVAPLAFAIWLAHYGFHFATGALSIIPVFQSFLLDHGVALLGRPDWTVGALLPTSWLAPLEILITLVGLIAGLYLVGERASHTQERLAAQLPWMLLLVFLALAAVGLFTMPMEMRGTNFMN